MQWLKVTLEKIRPWVLYHSIITSSISFVKCYLESHSGHFQETMKCNSGEKPPGLWTPPSITPGKSCIRVTVIYRHTQHNRPTQTLSLDQSMSVLPFKSPWNREAESLHVAVIGIPSSSASCTAQATHSSQKQPLLATWMLLVPNFLPPAAVTADLLPRSHPAHHPSALAVLSSGVEQTLPQQQDQKHSSQQLLHKNRYPCMWRKARHHWFCQEHWAFFQTHRSSHPYKTFS